MRQVSWIVLCLGVLITSCTKEPSKYEVAISKLGQKVEELTVFGIDTVAAKSYGDYTWYVDLGWCDEDSPVMSSRLIVGDGYNNEPVMLGYAHSGATLQIRIDGKSVVTSTDANLEIERTDYELITYPHYADLSNAIANRKSDTLDITIAIEGAGTKRQSFLSVVHADSRMIHKAFNFISGSGNEDLPFECATGAYAPPGQLQLSGRLNFSDWRYYTGTFLTAMSDVSQYYPRLDYAQYAEDHARFFTENVAQARAYTGDIHQLTGPFTLYERFNMLDDMGPQAAALLMLLDDRYSGNVDSIKGDPLFEYVEKSLKYVTETIPRLDDGTLSRITPEAHTVQSDDLFMACLLLIRASDILNNDLYLADAVQQLDLFHKHLWNQETGLYYHAYFEDSDQHSCCHWGRGMGWMMLIYSEMLKVLPKTHPARVKFITRLDAVLTSIEWLQADDGFWHQIIDDPTSYKETSVTAMFTKVLADAFIYDWVRNPTFRVAALKGGDALIRSIDADGNISGIVRGTPIFNTADEYKNHLPRENDPRGIGAVMWALMSLEEMR